MDIKNMNNEGLRELRQAIDKELEIRRNYQKEQLWNKVRTAISEYITHFGDIECVITNKDDYDEEVFIHEGWDLSEPGKMTH